jgi:hypothetical protein
MPLPLSSLSQICRAVADFLAGQLEASAHSIRVMLGTPAAAAAAAADNTTLHKLNLFFFRVEPSGFAFTTMPGEPWQMRLHCLITPFASAEDRIGEGENDLRLLGEVIRVFHEHPSLPLTAIDGEDVQLDVVLQPASANETRELWATQGDVVYRPSVTYEMALTPIVPRRRHLASPLVGGAGLTVLPTRRAPAPGTPPEIVVLPARARGAVETERDDWAPLIAFVTGGMLAESIQLPLSAVPASLQVLVAGRRDARVTLRWDVWTSDSGWSPGDGGGVVTVNRTELSPEDLGDPVSVALPLRDRAGQAVLFAEQSYTHPAERIPRNVRSNPLLVTVHP